ncbi:M20/M25/M40 family metallo-hydrolase [Sporolactobacillus terrae]|uniref:Peptidase M20 n=1 Tax=Sporolactobacillus terrae TaxID=269673 RepID=A0ABX5Q547_9BACL|nr:M20/M25/M40 family metallo-hydrolase [Sporolactobacillus terrae]QAA21750.1 peptidase M20 [Sporolactobacillus terrae]QAA24723.1 peptidase M20 [Sporolactobacillus terrae]UAK16553.1 M20/M25/M40 family metallo-hydrolase [Sporolactobacillus terrae]
MNEKNNTDTSEVIRQLRAVPAVQQALSFLAEDNARTTTEQIALTAVPAPPFKENARAAWMAERFHALGLKSVYTDKEGNVLGLLPGKSSEQKIVVSAHLDTVFSEDTSIDPMVKDGVVYAPGIADDGRGLAVLLTLIRALITSEIKPQHTLLFVATVGEEGLGDLRGVKSLFQTRKDIGGFISIEPGTPERITATAVGSHRYRIVVKGPGGHSFGNFGTPSAIHALGRAIAKISELTVPKNPVTTFTVGTVSGGTSINSIAEHAEMGLDMRSVAQDALLELEKHALACVRQAVKEENARWKKTDLIQAEIERVGERPAGTQKKTDPAVQTAVAAIRSFNLQPQLEPMSTDSNVAIHYGIPALTLSGGGRCGGMHTLAEYYDPKDAYVGAQAVLLTVLGFSGVENTVPSVLFAT